MNSCHRHLTSDGEERFHRLLTFIAYSMKATLLATFALIATLMTAAAGPYRHVVLFKFKDDASAESVKAVEDAFVALKDKISTIEGFEWGKNVSPEGLDQGFTHVYFVTFKDKAGLEVYLPHEAHKAFGAKLKPVLDKVLVVDYVAGME